MGFILLSSLSLSFLYIIPLEIGREERAQAGRQAENECKRWTDNEVTLESKTREHCEGKEELKKDKGKIEPTDECGEVERWRGW